ncbi:cardiac-enriched FHL2-interacting protein [Gopherus flavomarginatus]|uniref:cardiac-enriched FHL2-interacting protein n=1 Tax=Gopherus flavomarginatus TaxID=286002 RepID=UPI0021CBC57B|nr:cardiac-enriched FHL2-interacting protein [Gopherus flavomarginatus]XP_050815928.1 cardiac-enriched FHL2-interacting protein [Gopherus flavomarginatus]
MQGNKKHMDGLSDSSSIGSLLDDTDREVCSLTDRAFKSLCVAELEASDKELELVISPEITYQFSSKIHQGSLNHAIKKSNICNKLSSKNNKHTTWASTFQQLPKRVQEEKKVAKNSTAERKKPNLPISGPRKNKHASKVSCLIKTFDKTENQYPEGSLGAVKNSSQKCKLIQGNDMAFWDDTAISNIQRELSHFSDVCQDNHWLSDKHEVQKRYNKIDGGYCGPDGYHPAWMDTSNVFKANLTSSSKKTVKNRRGKVKEPVKKGNFLHSENSAFESWNAHHDKLSEKEEFADLIPKKEDITHFEETPLVKPSYTSEHKPPPRKVIGARIQEKDFLMDLFPPTTEFQDHVPLATVPQVLGPLIPVHPDPREAEFQVPILPAPIPQVSGPSTSVPQVSGPPLAPMSQTPALSSSPVFKSPAPPLSMSQVTCTEKKATKPELDYICPPWRKQRNIKGVAAKAQESSNEKLQLSGEEFSFYKKPSAVEPFADTTAVDNQVNSPESISPSFNITKLLTPIIPLKLETENQPVLVTPPIPEIAATKEHEGSGFSDYQSRDNYKSKAPSLLFNLKDVRKRVKSTYSPSPLLKEKNKAKENMKQESVKMNTTVSTFLEESSLELAERDELSHGPLVQTDSIQEKDNKTDLEGHVTDNYLSLSSSQVTVDTSFYQNQDHLQQDDSKNKDLLKDTENSENVSISGHQSNKHGLRKSRHYPSLKGYSRDNADAKAAQQMQMYNLSVQGHESERDAESQNGNDDPKIPPKLLSSAEDDAPYNANQTSARSSNENKGKSSSSSSECSFVPTVDQPFQEEPFSQIQLFQKACLEESQRSRSKMNVDDKQSSKGKRKPVEKEELQYYAFSNCDISTEEKPERKVAQDDSKSMAEEKLMSEKRKEVSSMNSAAEGNKDASTSLSEEPASPLSSNSFKPSLFLIKDNTFKSSPVIKAVKLPLLRSLSSEDTASSSYRDTESRLEASVEKDKQLYRQGQGTPTIQEIDRSLSRNIKEQNAREDALIRNEDANALGSTPAGMGFQGADNTRLIWEPTLSEDVGSFSLKASREDNEVTHTLLNKVGKSNEESVYHNKEKSTVGRMKHYLARSKSALGVSSAQNKLSSPSEEKTNYFKNYLLSNRRGGSCAKKIITREINSPAISSILENHVYCPVTSDMSRDIRHLEETPAVLDDLECTIVTNPRSDSIMFSAVTSPLSEKIASSSVTKAEDITNSTLLNLVTKNNADISAEEILDSMRRSLLTEDTSDSRMTNERSQSRMEKPLGKPPAVPPKSEKALRRAKKLANKRKKIEAQQKNLQTEHKDTVVRKLSYSGQIPLSPLALIHSPPSPVFCSPFPPTESSMVRLKGAQSVSPTPSLPATQRKLLQDPDSGQYFVVDLSGQVHLKTFYEPETGKYIQVPIRSSERGLHQTASLENLNSPCVLYPSALPLPVAPIRSVSQLSEPLSLMQKVPGAPAEAAEDCWQDGRDAQSPESQPYIEPVFDSYRQHAEETQCNSTKDTSPATNMDIISISDLEDFAVEGIS